MALEDRTRADKGQAARLRHVTFLPAKKQGDSQQKERHSDIAQKYEVT